MTKTTEKPYQRHQDDDWKRGFIEMAVDFSDEMADGAQFYYLTEELGIPLEDLERLGPK